MCIRDRKYVDTVLEEFGLSECRAVATPMDSNATFDKCSDEDERFDVSTYQKAIGCLTYLATNTRPDISAAVGILSRFMSDPGTVHWVGIKRILRYLQDTRDGRSLLPKTQAWCGFAAKCIQISLYCIVIFLVRAFLRQICVRFDSDLRQI